MSKQRLDEIASDIMARRPRVELTQAEWLEAINSLTARFHSQGIMNRIRLTPINEIPLMWDSLGPGTIHNRTYPQSNPLVTGGSLDTRMFFPTREGKYAMYVINHADENSMRQTFLGLHRECKWVIICVESDLHNWDDDKSRKWIPRRVHISSAIDKTSSSPPFFAQSGATGREFLTGMCEAINSRAEELRDRARLLSEYTSPATTILLNTQ